jgi:NADH:ubiquinone oxidoreductase subunit F (NADH-binding)/(2Fe-2S) ferredoxin
MVKFDAMVKKAKDKWHALQNQKKPVIFAGSASCGRAAGVNAVVNKLKEISKELPLEIIEVGCIGPCYLEPIIGIQKKGAPIVMYGKVNPIKVKEIVETYLLKDDPQPEKAIGTLGDKTIEGIPSIWDHPMIKSQVRLVLRNSGIIDPINIDHYLAMDGYQGLKKALSMKPKEVIDEVQKAGLRGRGGAGFPTGLKWKIANAEKDPEKYVICNADEGDPGAFMNRSLIEGDTHAVLEGMVIAGYAIGAGKGYIYCRAEYPLAIERFNIALADMRKYGLLGNNILDSGFSYDIEIKKGAGALVCGEETALISSIMGERGMPRAKPPYPAQEGVWGKPTVVNNVETLGTVPIILNKTSKWYRQYGTEQSKGTKTFSLSGSVKRTGLIEVPLGTTLKQVIYDIGGGIADDKKFKAIQVGGPSGGTIPESFIHTPLAYDELEKLDAILGIGGLVVVDEDTCVIDLARYSLYFQHSESCGKCVPCRIGNKQLLNLLDKIIAGKGSIEDFELLEELTHTVQEGSLCGLGKAAPNSVITSLAYFRDEYETHVIDKRCPAKVCKEMFYYQVDEETCIGCEICKRRCPVKAVIGEKKAPHEIIQEKCIKCDVCFNNCPSKAIKKIDRVVA